MVPAERLASVISIGIGLPGQVDVEAGTTYSPTNLGWPETSIIRAPLEEVLGRPVHIDNDLNTAVLAEWLQGVGMGCHNFCYMTIGTGLAVGMIIDGKLYRGAHSVAGELGHVVVDPYEEYCSCGIRGCLESLVSGPNILRRFHREAKQVETPEQEAPQGSEDIFALASKGHPIAAKVVRDTARYLAIGINTLAALLDPEVIAIGGGVSDAGAPLFEALDCHLLLWESAVVDTRGFHSIIGPMQGRGPVCGHGHDKLNKLGPNMFLMEGIYGTPDSPCRSW